MITFDQYFRAIRDARVTYTLTKPSTLEWKLDQFRLSDLSIQRGTDGGGSIVEGSTAANLAIVLFARQPAAPLVLLDGAPVLPGTYVLLPPSSQWIIACKEARSWTAVAIPASLAYRRQTLKARPNWHRSALLAPAASGELERLDALVAAGPRGYWGGGSDGAPRELRDEVLAICLDMLSRAGDIDAPPIVPERNDAATLVRRVMEFLRYRPAFCSRIDRLCAELHVSERSLLRAFRRVIDMGPKKYLKLRQLNMVRSALYESSGSALSLTTFCTDFGVTELGRFAGEYKSLFGEAPSQSPLTFRSQRSTGAKPSV